MKTGYKVLTHQRRSCVIALRMGGRYYPVNKVAKAKRGYGPLCVFANKRDAERFAAVEARPHEWLIAKCKYEPSRLEKIWHSRNPDWGRSLCFLPKSTVLATAVTCLE